MIVSRYSLIERDYINKNRKDFLIKMFLDTLIIENKGVNNPLGN